MTIHPGFARGQMLRDETIEDAEFTEVEISMTQAEKEAHIATLDDAEKAALDAIKRVADETALDFIPEIHRVKSAFFQLRDRVNSAQLTKD